MRVRNVRAMNEGRADGYNSNREERRIELEINIYIVLFRHFIQKNNIKSIIFKKSYMYLIPECRLINRA